MTNINVLLDRQSQLEKNGWGFLDNNVDFTDADFRQVDHNDPHVRALSFRNTRGLIDAGRPHGYRFLAVRQTKKPMRIRAGCRWFTVAQARKHWRYRSDRREIRAALEYVVEVAKARGWRVS